MFLTVLFCRFICSLKCGPRTNCIRLSCGLLTVTSLVCNVALLVTLHKTAQQQHHNMYNYVDAVYVEFLNASIPDSVRESYRSISDLLAVPEGGGVSTLLLTSSNNSSRAGASAWGGFSLQSIFYGLVENKNDNIIQTNLQQQQTHRQYLAFDEAAPRVLWARSHHLPNAVPPHRVIPRDQAENETFHILKRTNTSRNSILGVRGRKRPYYSDGTPGTGSYDWAHHNYTLDHRALYLYNPSVLPLFSNAKNNTADDDNASILSNETLLALTGGDASVAYLSTFRANTAGNCFGSDRVEVMQTGEQQISYLAVALLDRDLNVIADSDVLIDIHAGPNRNLYFQQWFQEDCKVVAVAGHLHFLCNQELLRVTIARRPSNNQAQQPRSNNVHTGNDTQIPYLYPNIYGNGLEITLHAHGKIAEGKNLNIFRVRATRNNRGGIATNAFDYYLQVWPLPHRYHRLEIPDEYYHSRANNTSITTTTLVRAEPEQQQSTALLPPPSFDGPDTLHTIITCRENEQPRTWITNCTGHSKQIKSFFGDDKDHGTACCITVPWKNTTIDNSNNPADDDTTVLVGISHTKTSAIKNPWWLRDIRNHYRNHAEDIYIGPKRYLSRFVAYQSQPPFDIVARSGWFCLGFANNADDEASSHDGINTLAGVNRQYRLDLFSNQSSIGNNNNNNNTLPTNNDTYNCPMIHFATGITEFVGDPSKAIIAYGVSDCHPRVIVVEKQDIVRRLLGSEDNNGC